jgi:hypothetical protein
MIPIIAAIGIGVISSLAGKAATTLIERNFGGSTAIDKHSFDTVLEQSQRTKPTRPSIPEGDRQSKDCQHSHPEIPAPTLTGVPMADASVSLLTRQLAEYRSLASMSNCLTHPPLTLASSRKRAEHHPITV